MCGGSTTISTSQNSTTKATPTPEEQAMEKIQLDQMKSYAPAQTQMYQNAFSTGNNLLNAVNSPNSEQWKTLLGGVTDQQTRSMVNQQDLGLQGSLQQAGIYNSGSAASGRLRAGTELANTNAQFNVGTLQNALNLALGGQAQVQGTAANNSSQLGQQLAGLRSTNTTGTGYQVNPQTGTNLGILGTWGGSYCWVAAEIFGGWDEPKTHAARFYIGNLGPRWFSRFYLKHGERIAAFIHNKPILKAALRPLFEFFVNRACAYVQGRVI